LARTAGVPLVLDCILEDGTVGEVLRVPTGRTGCLLCHRARLIEEGLLDPEPGIDLRYGAGLGTAR
jgi:hypothetical protein